jgi:para-nitrobenzyl esterase
MRGLAMSGLARGRIIAVAVAALVLAGTVSGVSLAASRSQPGGGPVVVTADGAVRGKTAGGMRQFLGIPYAAPPVGRLRWRPPRAAARWRGIRQATGFAPHCPQPATPFGLASMSENCLYLNVFAPARRASGLPVMVWVHGGSFLVGESNDYIPSGLVGRGVIVITINYRIGVLGFLADSALASHPGGPSGNYGLMDQQAALRWVQANIRRFGGNPRDVTLFGQSAGGLSVLGQLASPGARGLFQRAIVESGTYDLVQPSLSAAELGGKFFAARVGCATDTAACLRRLPVSTIIHNEDLSYFPNVDGHVLPRSVGEALASGRFSRVPVIMGTNHDEWRLFVALNKIDGGPKITAANYQASIQATAGVSATVAAAIAARYPLRRYSSPSVAVGAVGTDALFACPALTAERSLSRYVPTYAYEFNDEKARQRFLGPVGFPYGAAHTSELQYLFSLPTAPIPGRLSATQRRLAATMQKYWTAFAWLGTPAGRWPRFGRAGRWLSLVSPRPRLETGFAAAHLCPFWAKARP